MEKVKQSEFLVLYEPVHESLTRYCRTIAGNLHDAEDLVNDTVLNAWQNFEKIRDKTSFKSYLFAIASNLSKKKFRRVKFRGEIEEKELAEIVDITQNPEYVAEYRLIYEKIMALPRKVSEAMILFHIADFSLEEIQKIQGGSLSGVKQRLKRGREKLLKELNSPNQVQAVILFLTL